MTSPSCHCRFLYPGRWFFTPGNDDPSKPKLGVSNYNPSSSDHLPIPDRFIDIGIDWHTDPLGLRYQALITRHFSPEPGQPLTVAGRAAMDYTHWTAPPRQGGLYNEHIYVFVPWYQRDYDLWLQAATPSSDNVAEARAAFRALVGSLQIFPPRLAV